MLDIKIDIGTNDKLLLKKFTEFSTEIDMPCYWTSEIFKLFFSFLFAFLGHIMLGSATFVAFPEKYHRFGERTLSRVPPCNQNLFGFWYKISRFFGGSLIF